jgi:hypothetical protein
MSDRAQKKIGWNYQDLQFPGGYPLLDLDGFSTPQYAPVNLKVAVLGSALKRINTVGVG